MLITLFSLEYVTVTIVESIALHPLVGSVTPYAAVMVANDAFKFIFLLRLIIKKRK